MAAMKKKDIIGFIKHNGEIGLYQADYDAWILDLKTFCALNRIPESTVSDRKDGRFEGRLTCPIRKEDVNKLVAWFDANAALEPETINRRLGKLDYLGLDESYEDYLPVVLYDFDALISYENPDLNPHTPYDDFLPEGWKNIVVEGFDALVPDDYIYWSRFAARLEHRAEDTL
jgi:hypothetical protein